MTIPCPYCAYDVRATLAQGLMVCPECGGLVPGPAPGEPLWHPSAHRRLGRTALIVTLLGVSLGLVGGLTTPLDREAPGWLTSPHTIASVAWSTVLVLLPLASLGVSAVMVRRYAASFVPIALGVWLVLLAVGLASHTAVLVIVDWTRQNF